MIEVRVPATSANMGAGFDTMGIALNLYNTIQVRETESGLKIVNLNCREYLPKNENNLIYRAIMRVFDEVGYQKKGLAITQNSKIPVTRGLGSSSACIVGGLLAGNVLSGRKLTYPDILNLAAEMEGHPDNVAPALYGGFCVSARVGDKAICQSVKLSPKFRYAVMVPDFFVPTKKSRGLLPETVSLGDASHNISRAVLFALGLAQGNTEFLKIGVDDRLHQPYREQEVEGLSEIFKKSYELGAKASFLSGSGPTVLSVLDGNYREFCGGMRDFFLEQETAWSCRILQVDNVGAVVKTVGGFRKDD